MLHVKNTYFPMFFLFLLNRNCAFFPHCVRQNTFYSPSLLIFSLLHSGFTCQVSVHMFLPQTIRQYHLKTSNHYTFFSLPPKRKRSTFLILSMDKVFEWFPDALLLLESYFFLSSWIKYMIPRNQKLVLMKHCFPTKRIIL